MLRARDYHAASKCCASAIFLCVFLHTSATFAAETSYKPHYKKAFRYLRQQQFDSSLVQFQMAANNGMPRDSMLYLFAHVFYMKGALDTALAFNLAAQSREKNLRLALLRQRRIIFQTLAIKKEERAVKDSLAREAPLLSPHNAIPDVDFRISNGIYGLEESWARQRLAELAPLSIESNKTVSPQAGAKANIGWWMDVDGTQKWYLGGIARIDKIRFLQPILLDYTLLRDSLSVSLGAKSRIRFTPRFSMDGEWSRRRDTYGRAFVYAHGSLLYSVPMSHGMALLETSCAWRSRAAELAAAYTPGIDVYLERILSRMTAFADFSITGNIQNELTFNELSYERYFIADTAHPLQFYTDSIGSRTIAVPSSKYDFIRFQNELLTVSHTGNAQTVIPYSTLSSSALFGIGIPFRPAIQLKSSIEWTGRVFMQEHAWYIYQGAPVQQSEPVVRIARSSADGKDYLLLHLTEYDSAVCTGPVGINPHHERRFDNTFSANLFFDCAIGSLMRLSTVFYFSRTFTTLDKTAPVIVIPWNTGMLITFNFSRKSFL